MSIVIIIVMIKTMIMTIIDTTIIGSEYVVNDTAHNRVQEIYMIKLEILFRKSF